MEQAAALPAAPAWPTPVGALGVGLQQDFAHEPQRKVEASPEQAHGGSLETKFQFGNILLGLREIQPLDRYLALPGDGHADVESDQAYEILRLRPIDEVDGRQLDFRLEKPQELVQALQAGQRVIQPGLLELIQIGQSAVQGLVAKESLEHDRAALVLVHVVRQHCFQLAQKALGIRPAAHAGRRIAKELVFDHAQRHTRGGRDDADQPGPVGIGQRHVRRHQGGGLCAGTPLRGHLGMPGNHRSQVEGQQEAEIFRRRLLLPGGAIRREFGLDPVEQLVHAVQAGQRIIQPGLLQFGGKGQSAGNACGQPGIFKDGKQLACLAVHVRIVARGRVGGRC